MKSPSVIRLLSLTVAIGLVLLNSAAYARMLQGAEVTVTGSGVKIEGASAATGATFMSGNRIQTGLGSNAVLSINGARVTVNEDTDATISFDASAIHVNITCGSVTANSTAGNTFDVTTGGDTNVFVTSGRVTIDSGGSTSHMSDNQARRFTGNAKVTTTAASQFDVTTALCTCKCLPSVGVPGGAAGAGATGGAGLGSLAIAGIVAGAVAAVVVPVVVANQNNNVTGTLPAVSISSAG